MIKNKYILKIISISVLIFLMNFIVLSNIKDGNNTLDKDTLVVGMELKFPPFETVDEKGKPTGVSVELAKEIGKILNKNIEIKSVDYPSLIPALQSENIDMIISSMTITEERLQSINFSNEYAKSDLGLLLNKDTNIDNPNDLNKEGIKVAVKTGTLGASWAKKYLSSSTIKEFSEVSAAMLDVNNGASNAFIYDPLTLIEGSKNLTNTKVDITPLENVQGWGIGVRLSDSELKASLDSALDIIKNSDFYDTMREKYLKEDVEKYKSYGLDYFF